MRNFMRADGRGPSGVLPGGPSDLQGYRCFVDEQGVQYASDWFVYSVTIGTLAAGATKAATLAIMADSAFEWLETTATVFDSSGDNLGDCNRAIEVTITDAASSRNLMSAAIPIGLMAGSGGTPFVLPIPRRFMPRTTISIVAHNYSSATVYGDTASGSVQISLIGRKIFMARPSGRGFEGQELQRFNSWQDPQTGRRYSEDLYSYVFAPATTNAAASSDKALTIEGDSDFEWIMGAFGWHEPDMQGAEGQTLLAQILDGGTNRQLLSQATNIMNIGTPVIAAQGIFPFMLLQPRIFLSKSPVTLSLSNTDSAANLTNGYFVMHGRKIFELG